MLRNRRYVQLLFLSLTLVAVFVVKGNAERWCPFGGVEAIYTYIQEGNMVCSLGVSNFYILGAVLLLTLLLKRVFCSHVCPIGTISELLRIPGKWLKRKPLAVPAKLDRVLALMKYVVLGTILYFTWRAGELMFRGYDPCYALISRHGEDIAIGSYVVAGLVVVSSLFITIPFCRWFCPLAAVMNPLSRLGLFRVARHDDKCTHCGRCRIACPSAIEVDKATTITHARCTNCMNCINACPEKDNGALTWGLSPQSAVRKPQGVVVVILFVLISFAVATAYIAPMPSFVFEQGERSGTIASETLHVQGLKCRGSATLFTFFLCRNDIYEIPGYIRVEAWPGPQQGRAKVYFEKDQADRQAILDAITEPFYDAVDNRWRSSPFVIEGYDPLAVVE